MEDTEKELQAARRLMEQRRQASKRFREKMESVQFLCTPEEKSALRAAAEKEGMSMRAYILWRCIGKR